MIAKSRIVPPERIRWLKRFRPPGLLALLGTALSVSLAWLPEADLLGLSAHMAVSLLARIAFVAAVGWAITTTIDALVKRRIAALRLDVADNLEARKSATRLDVVRRIWIVAGGTLTLAAALTVIPGVRQIGVSLFASAGIAGLAVGLAARPVLSNLLAGLQIAFTQPVRIDDAVVVEGEWGWIEEIGLFYVVIKLWDWRRLVVPLSYFIEKPFQNWTRKSASIIGSVVWSLDHRAPVGAIRERLKAICEATPLWDGNVVNLQVVEAAGPTITLRALASARTSPEAWDLRCRIREEMLTWLQAEHPGALPRYRIESAATDGPPAGTGSAFEPDMRQRPKS